MPDMPMQPRPSSDTSGPPVPRALRRIGDDLRRSRRGADEFASPRRSELQTNEKEETVDYRLELVVVPVHDMDRAKQFYAEAAGFELNVDHRGPGDFRVIQLTPPGSGCSVALMRNPERAGAAQGLHLVVEDLAAAREELTSRGVEVSEPFHFGGAGQQPGLDPQRRSYASFASFADLDGNGWLVQEVHRAE
jgi:predicted enzyme related to lactoylglutathione lyase